MVWQQWVFVIITTFVMLMSVASIGKPRQPLTPGVAVGALVINALLIVLVVSI